MIKFNCPHCQQSLRVPVSRADTEAVCPGCHAQLRVPPTDVTESSEALLAPPVLGSAPAITDTREAVIQTPDFDTAISQSGISPEAGGIASIISTEGAEESSDANQSEQRPPSVTTEPQSTDMDEARFDQNRDADDQRIEDAQSDILKDRRRRVEVSSQIFDDLAERVTEDTVTDARTISHRRIQGQLGVSRISLYLFAALILFVALTSFWLGTMINPTPPSQVETEIAGADDYVNFEGRVTFRAEDDPEAIDELALVILLPEDSLPSEKFVENGISPGVMVDESLPSVQEIRRLGGDITTSGTDGRFTMKVASGHRYYLLVVSALKPAVDEPSDQDLSELSNYFGSPARLLDGKFYRWSLEVVNTHRDIRVYHR